MTRKVSNRKVGPKSKENPTGKHKSLVQKVTYSYSSKTPFNKDEWARKEKEFRSSDSWAITPLLDGYKLLAITYLENSPSDHTKCEKWQWGFMTSKESKAAAELDGGFEAAFQMLFGIYLINKELDGGDMEKAIIHSLRLVHSARTILAAELEPLYHAGKTKTEAANNDKSKEFNEDKEKARPVFQDYLDKGQTTPNAAKSTSIYLKDKHGIIKAPETIRGWFKPPK
jgi:hypothetical protein